MQTRLMQTTLKLDDAQAEKMSRLNLDTAHRTQAALAPARNPSMREAWQQRGAL